MKFCSVCLSKKIEFFLKDNNLIYWKCNKCEAKLLDKENYISFNEEKKHYLKHNNIINENHYRNFLSIIIRPLKKIISKNDIGLDYGCGYAPALVDILKKDGFKIEYYDPFFFPKNEVFLKKYKFIISTEVVEHFFKPYEEFSKIDNLLENNSWFAVMTSFLPKDYLFCNWHYRRDPTHVVFYSKRTFEVIAYQRNWRLFFPTENVVFFNKN